MNEHIAENRATRTTLGVFGTTLLTASPRRFGRGEVVIEHGVSIDGTPWSRVDLVSADGIRFAAVTFMGDERQQVASLINGDES